MLMIIGPDIWDHNQDPCPFGDTPALAGDHVHADRWGCPGDGPGETQLAEIASVLADHQDHPNIDVATHLADLFVGAATVCAKSDGPNVDASDFDALWPHLCREHVRAAVVLLCVLRDADGTDPEGRLTFGLRWIRRFLGAE